MGILFKLAGRTLVKNKTKTFIICIGIFLAIFLLSTIVILYSSYNSSVSASYIKQEGDWSLYTKNKKLIEEIESDEIESIVGFTNYGYSQLEDIKDAEKPYLFIKNLFVQGKLCKPISVFSGNLPTKNGEAVIHKDYAKLYGMDIGSTITLEVGKRKVVANDHVLWQNGSYLGAEKEYITKETTRSYKIVGITDKLTVGEYGMSPGYTILAYDEIIGEKSETFIKFFNPKNARPYVDDISTSAGVGVKPNIVNIFQESEQSVLLIIVIIFCIIIFAVCVIFILNSYMMNYEERVKNNAIFSSLGASKMQLLSVAILENFFLTLIVAPIGIMFSYLILYLSVEKVIYLINNISFKQLDFVLSYKFSLIATIFFLGVAMSLLSAIIAFFSFNKKNIMLSMRQNNTINIKVKKKTKKKLKTKERFCQNINDSTVDLQKENNYCQSCNNVTVDLQKENNLNCNELSLQNQCNAKSETQKQDNKLNKKKEKKERRKIHFKNIENELVILNITRQRTKMRATIVSIILSIVFFLSMDMFCDGAIKQVKQANAQFYEISANIDGNKGDRIFKELLQVKGVDYGCWKISGNLGKMELDVQALSDTAKTYYATGDKEAIAYNILDDALYAKLVKSYGKTLATDSVLATARAIDYDENVKFDLFRNESFDINLTENEYETNVKIENFNAQIINNTLPIELETIMRNSGINIFINQSQVDRFFNIAPNSHQAYFQCGDYLGAYEAISELNEKEGWNISVNNELEYRDKMVNNFQIIDVFVKIFLAVIMIISVINLFGSIFANTTKRKKELAVLSSIGMEDKSIKKMLYLEYLIIFAFALLVSVVFTVVIAFIMKAIFKFTEFAIPIAEFAIIGVSYGILIFLAAALAIKFTLKGNIIDNMKNENE